MKYGTLSLRVSAPIWQIPERRAELLGMLERHPHAFDEIALFTSFSHPPAPMNEMSRVAAVAAEVIPIFKATGYACGINMLATVGHHEENLEHSLNEPWQRMMDIHGNITRGSFCPLDPGLRGYIRDAYVALAQANPDFVWIDDDVRLEGHMPIIHCCFCDRCVESFSERTGESWTREKLAEAFNSEDKEQAQRVRTAWLRSNSDKMLDVMKQVRNAVDSARPGLPVGLMCGESFYNGYGYREWLDELSRGADRPAMLRPGGGFYVDVCPTALMQKSHSLGRQCAQVSKSVVDLQSEIECFPYALLAKSVKMICTEAAVYIADGCTGAAFNIMGSLGAPIGEFEVIFAEVEKHRDFLETISSTFGRSDTEGIWQLSHPDLLAVENLGSEWFAGAKVLPVHGLVDEMSTAGLPIAATDAGAAVTLITGNAAEAFKPTQIEKILSGAVMMDGAALECLTNMGFGDLLGFKVAGTRLDDTVEELTDDPINTGFVGWHRDCRQSFKWWNETAYLLEPTDAGARVISNAVDYVLKKIAPISGLFQNKLGGHIAVLGFFPWTFTGSLVRTTQLKRISLWLSKNRLPAYVESFHKIAIWCRRSAKDSPAIFLLNTSLDDASDVRVKIKDAPEILKYRTPFEVPIELVGKSDEDGYTTFTLPKLGGWDMAMLF